jgi:hypothetical protein
MVLNGFAFVGLTLDILGTSFGVWHALRLRKPMLKTPEPPLRARQLKTESGMWFVSADMERALKADLSARQKFWKMRRYFVDDHDKSLKDHLGLLFGGQLEPALMWYCHHSVLGVEHCDAMLGTDPVTAIGAGTICLLISILLMAVSQPRPTWVTCASIAGVLVLSMISALFSPNPGMPCFFS